MQRGAGRARCHLLPSLLRRAPRFAVLLFFRLKAWTLNAVFSGNRLHDEPENLLRRSARVSGGRGASHLSPDEAPRRVVSWAWFVAAHRVLFPVSADGLRARGGGAAVPHVLATHLHPRAPPAPAGLLLVSEPPRPPPGAPLSAGQVSRAGARLRPWRPRVWRARFPGVAKAGCQADGCFSSRSAPPAAIRWLNAQTDEAVNSAIRDALSAGVRKFRPPSEKPVAPGRNRCGTPGGPHRDGLPAAPSRGSAPHPRDPPRVPLARPGLLDLKVSASSALKSSVDGVGGILKRSWLPGSSRGPARHPR